MDYVFRRDLNGRFHAELSMGHEVFGLWLSDELGTNLAQLALLLENINLLQNQQCWDYRMPGREFVLTMTQEGVEARAALLDSDEDAPDELEHYDQESQANCGLDDFRQLLEEWQAFVTDGR